MLVSSQTAGRVCRSTEGPTAISAKTARSGVRQDMARKTRDLYHVVHGLEKLVESASNSPDPALWDALR